MNKIKQNNQGKKCYLLIFATNSRQSRAFRMQFIFSGWGLRHVTCFIFATNLRQSRAFRMQFIFSGWGLRPHTPSRGFAPAPYGYQRFRPFSGSAPRGFGPFPVRPWRFRPQNKNFSIFLINCIEYRKSMFLLINVDSLCKPIHEFVVKQFGQV